MCGRMISRISGKCGYVGKQVIRPGPVHSKKFQEYFSAEIFCSDETIDEKRKNNQKQTNVISKHTSNFRRK